MNEEELILFFNKYNVNELDMMLIILDYAFQSYDTNGKIVRKVLEKVYKEKLKNDTNNQKITQVSDLSKKINRLDNKELIYFESLTDEVVMRLSSITHIYVERELKDISILDEKLLEEIERRHINKENDNFKSIEELSFDEINMNYAINESLNSADPNTQVGVAYVSENGKLLSVGYNKPPKGWDKTTFPWNRDVKKYGEENTKYPYVIHAEMDGLVNYKGERNELINSTAYVTLFPCPNCAKLMIQNGITRVVYKDDKYHDTLEAEETRILFKQCNIEAIFFDEIIKEKENNPKIKLI